MNVTSYHQTLVVHAECYSFNYKKLVYKLKGFRTFVKVLSLQHYYFLCSYGDLTPRSVPAKLLSIVWFLIGLILNGIVVGFITTALVTINEPKKVTLYNTKVSWFFCFFFWWECLALYRFFSKWYFWLHCYKSFIVLFLLVNNVL